ncbi:MAG TPA: sialidase family protein [Ktedonobacteraceae bacterium]|nr:sialidase family protein [Ktedonobacteraceae bacterium]
MKNLQYRSAPCFSWPVLVLPMLVVLLSLSLQTHSAQAAHVTPQIHPALSFHAQSRIGFHSGDDWEPSLTADRFGHVYVLFKHYDVSGGQTCPGCDLHLLLQRSDDGGNTWSVPRPIAPGKVKGGQFDPQIAVDPLDGRTLWASFLQNETSRIAVVHSTDFGHTWSKPLIVSDLPPGLDKDELAVRGKTILVAYDDDENTWASVSTDGGTHWATHLVFPTSPTFGISLAAGAAIDSQGAFYVSWDSFDQAHSENGQGPVTLWISKSTDQGQTWTRKVIVTSPAAAPICDSCGFDYLSSQMALQIGMDDTIYLFWNSNVDGIANTPERVFFARSTNHGKTYSLPVDISNAPAGVEHCFPALTVGATAGDVRLGWMDTRTGAWNVFFRKSTNGGVTWSKEVQLSSYVPGYPYLTRDGFGLPYGDYFSLAVDSQNRTQAVFGEGPSYAGPGNQWVTHSMNEP